MMTKKPLAGGVLALSALLIAAGPLPMEWNVDVRTPASSSA